MRIEERERKKLTWGNSAEEKILIRKQTNKQTKQINQPNKQTDKPTNQTLWFDLDSLHNSLIRSIISVNHTNTHTYRHIEISHSAINDSLWWFLFTVEYLFLSHSLSFSFCSVYFSSLKLLCSKQYTYTHTMGQRKRERAKVVPNRIRKMRWLIYI